MKILFFFAFFCLSAQAQTIVLKNDLVRREFASDGHVWRTVKFARADGSDAIEVNSEEFELVYFNGGALTVNDFVSRKEPQLKIANGIQTLTIHYQAGKGDKVGPDFPNGVTVTYTAKNGEPYIRKNIEFEFRIPISIDRLEVERFSLKEKAKRGGRGEPVFVDGKWFFGLEYPAGHSRHTDGNTPLADSHHYEKVGNYSFVDLDGHDRDDKARPGLLRLFHFPGDAKNDGQNWKIVSKTAVAGIGTKNQPIELAFEDYLATIAKPPRSFTHYNNWFDPAGKNLRGENFVDVYRAIKKNIEPYGIKLDAMVPDNGWQNRQSIWEPGGQFAGGFDDLKRLSENLRAEGTSLGLWLSLDGTTNDIAWGEKQGFARAKANPYFSQYFAHYSLSQPQYKAAMLSQLRHLTKDAGISYYKHDFNHLSDIGEGNGHPATDRHGHEANVDAMIEMLDACREINPNIYQNLTNWMWFSPWWLMHGDAIWMLAGDDGFNGNWPEISGRAMGTTDRDTFIWRMWGNEKDRPLLPISRLMTHGIVRNAAGQMQSKSDTLEDWADHVMMYYGRGVQMKEWYLSPSAMSTEEWRVLCSIHNWARTHEKALNNTVFVGGRPDEGQAYGYIGWDGNNGVLVARNPSPQTQILRVPCDASTWFRGKSGQNFAARVSFPYNDNWPTNFRSGEAMNFALPGYATMAFEIGPGKPQKTVAIPAVPKVQTKGAKAEMAVPDEEMSRCDLLVIGYEQLPEVKINGITVNSYRDSTGKINDFASYARSGMPSDKARPWRMAAYDVKSFRGQKITVQFVAQEEMRIESWWLLQRPVKSAATNRNPWSPSQNVRRQTVQILPETRLGNSAIQRALTADELKNLKSATLTIEAFGVNDGQFGDKEIWLNDAKIGLLPVGGDEWQRAKIEVPPENVKAESRLEIRCKDTGDKFKFRGALLTVQLVNGDFVKTSSQVAAQTSSTDWAFFEGAAFPTPQNSAPISLDFKHPFNSPAKL